jgi:hypothetical protein
MKWLGDRLEALKNAVEKNINNIPEKEITVEPAAIIL